jgi:hypothetical protein
VHRPSPTVLAILPFLLLGGGCGFAIESSERDPVGAESAGESEAEEALAYTVKTVVNAYDYVANADVDDTPGLQAAILDCQALAAKSAKHHCTLHLGNRDRTPRVYNLTGGGAGAGGARLSTGLVLFGKRITIDGHNSTLLSKAVRNSYLGDTFDIRGLTDGTANPKCVFTAAQKNCLGALLAARKHPATPFKMLDARHTETHKGAVDPVEHVVVQNLIVTSDPNESALMTQRNCIGIVGVDDVQLRNVTCNSAHQSAVGAVAVPVRNSVTQALESTAVRKLKLTNVHARNSGEQAFRFNVYEGATDMEVTMNGCSSVGIDHYESGTWAKFMGERKVHLWFHPSLPADADPLSPHTSLVVRNSTFGSVSDKSGQVVVTDGVSHVEFSNNTFHDGVYVRNRERRDQGKIVADPSDFQFRDNTVDCTQSASPKAGGKDVPSETFRGRMKAIHFVALNGSDIQLPIAKLTPGYTAKTCMTLVPSR